MPSLVVTMIGSLPAAASALDWIVEHRTALAAPALVGLCWAFRRREDRIAGFGALLAALGLGAVLWMRVDRESRTEPLSVVVVSGEPLDAETGAQLELGVERARTESDNGVELRYHVERDRPAGEALAAAALVAPADAELLYVWNRESPVGPPLVSGPRARGFARSAWIGFDPADCSIRPVARPVVGRPVDLEVVLPDAAFGSGAVLRWSERQEFVEPARPIRLQWLPTEPGEAELWVDWIRDGQRIRWHLRIDVAETDRKVTVVGDPGGRLAALLKAQGLGTTPLDSLTDLRVDGEGATPDWFVVGRRLDPAEQEVLRGLVDRGAGAFLFELGDGALPSEGEPLADWSPFTPKPEPEPETDAEGTEPDAPPGAEPPTVQPPVDGPPSDGPGSDEPPSDEPEGDRPNSSDPSNPTESQLPEFDPIFGDTSDTDASTVTEAEVERRNVSLLLLIDQSESMDSPISGSRRRMIDYARTAARQTAAQLRDGDELGIVGFSGGTHEHLPLGPVPDSAVIERVLVGIQPGGGTNLPNAVNYAVRELLRRDRAVRHAVVLTDAAGIGSPNLGPRQAIGYASQLAEAGGGVSLILIGDRRNVEPRDIEVGQQIASLGGGRLVVTDDGRQIPTLILAEVRRVLGVAARTVDGGAGESGSGRSSNETGTEESATDQATDDEPTGPTQAEGGEALDPEPGEPSAEPSAPEVEQPTEDEREDEGRERPGADPAADGPPAQSRLEVLPLAPSPLIDPFVDDGFPDLTSVARVEGREESDQLLAVFPEGRPLLAFVNRGLGRLGGFAAPFSDQWWDDPRLPAMVATWAQAIAPATGSDQRPEALASTEVLPRQPIGAERASLEELFPDGLEPVERFELEAFGPAPVHTVERSLVPDDALLALLGFLVLVLVERFARRDQ